MWSLPLVSLSTRYHNQDEKRVICNALEKGHKHEKEQKGLCTKKNHNISSRSLLAQSHRIWNSRKNFYKINSNPVPAHVAGRSCGGREAGDLAPGGGEDATPSWRPASSKSRGVRLQGRSGSPEIQMISKLNLYSFSQYISYRLQIQTQHKR